jgi:AraC-like DNA-binding protein
MTEPDRSAAAERSFGFTAWRGSAERMLIAHVHTDVEWNFLLSGSMRYFLAGRFEVLQPGRLSVFWAGMPHRLVEAQPGTELVWVTVPLAWILQWGLDERFSHRLLAGDLLREPTDDPWSGRLDEALLRRWAADFRHGASAEVGRIAMLECEARLRRLALADCSAPPDRPDGMPDGALSEPVERMARFIGLHFREPLSVADVAAAVGLQTNYAMQLFKRRCGMTVWEYLTRLRVGHAQRLLLSTDWTMHRVASESGFGSVSRFYEAFHRFGGGTPRGYRVAMARHQGGS